MGKSFDKRNKNLFFCWISNIIITFVGDNYY